MDLFEWILKKQLKMYFETTLVVLYVLKGGGGGGGGGVQYSLKFVQCSGPSLMHVELFTLLTSWILMLNMA